MSPAHSQVHLQLQERFYLDDFYVYSIPSKFGALHAKHHQRLFVFIWGFEFPSVVAAQAFDSCEQAQL